MLASFDRMFPAVTLEKGQACNLLPTSMKSTGHFSFH